MLLKRGPNVKLRLRNGMKKMVHLNRCKSCSPPLWGHSEIDTGEMSEGKTDYTESESQREPEFSNDEADAESTSSILSQPGPYPISRRSGRRRQRPKWLQDDSWIDNLSDDSADAT